MSSAFSNNNNDEENAETSNHEDDDDESSGEVEESQSAKDYSLYEAITRNDAEAVQRALRNGARVHCYSDYILHSTPLMEACARGYNEIVRILLDAGASPWSTSRTWSVMVNAIEEGHLSIAEILLNHDEGLLEIASNNGETPLQFAIDHEHSEIVHFLLDRGANALVTTRDGWTTLMLACHGETDLEIVRRLLAAGVSIEARDTYQRTALDHAARQGNTETMRELIVEHNANMYAMDIIGETPFDAAKHSNSAGGKHAFLIRCYGNKLMQRHDQLALHAILEEAEYSFAEDAEFHPPLSPLRISLLLGNLTLNHLRILLSDLDTEQIRNRDESGKLPIHIACRNNAPVEVLALIVEQDPTTLHMADFTSGALPLHECCCGAVDDSSVIFLVEQGGVGTLAARNRNGALPLHVLCGSQNPSLRIVQFMIQSFSGSLAARTNAGRYPFMIAACESSTASLSVVYELVRTNPDLVIPC